MSQIEVSVIIPTRNRASLLTQMLDSLARQTMPLDRFEVLVVDNASNDNTREAALHFTSTFPHFSYLFQKNVGLHSGRHMGLQNSRGNILVFADDDIVPFTSWLEGMELAFENPKVALVGGRVLPLYEAPPPAWEKKLWIATESGTFNPYFSLLDFGAKQIEIPGLFVFGCNFGVRKQIALELGGFHPDAFPKDRIQLRGNGEAALAQKIQASGHLIVYEPTASVYHHVSKNRLTMAYVEDRAFLEGVTGSYADGRLFRQPRYTQLFRMYLRYCLAQIKARTILRGIDREIRLRVSRGFWQGYYFHWKELRKSQGLMNWVLRENYLE